jgi:hypothetical protein
LYFAVISKDEDVERKAMADVLKMTPSEERVETRKVRSVRPVINTNNTIDPTNTVLGKFEPEFLIPIPPFLPPDEAIWLNPGSCPEVTWDWEMGAEKGLSMEVREMMQRAMRSQLNA